MVSKVRWDNKTLQVGKLSTIFFRVVCRKQWKKREAINWRPLPLQTSARGSQVPPLTHTVKNTRPSFNLKFHAELRNANQTHTRAVKDRQTSCASWNTCPLLCPPCTVRLEDARNRPLFPFCSAPAPVSAPPASLLSPRVAQPLPSLSLFTSSHTVFQEDLGPIRLPLHTHKHTHSTGADCCDANQSTMAGRDAAATLLVGLLILCHTWRGERDARVPLYRTSIETKAYVKKPARMMKVH